MESRKSADCDACDASSIMDVSRARVCESTPDKGERVTCVTLKEIRHFWADVSVGHGAYGRCRPCLVGNATVPPHCSIHLARTDVCGAPYNLSVRR
jgi:hypothetical protein